MLVPMNERIQSVIIAVQSYKKFVIADSIVSRCTDPKFDWYKETFKYFNSLPELPEGMMQNLLCFNAILSYPIEETLTTESSDLMRKFTFGY